MLTRNNNRESEENKEAYESMSSNIRIEELKRMFYEDQRRRAIIHQIARISTVPSFQRSNEPMKLPNNVESSFLWLSMPRNLILADRNNKEYMWTVILDRSNGLNTFILQWEDIVDKTIAGSVEIGPSMEVMESIKDPTSISLIVGTNTKLLRNTGGRPFINIKCNSETEASKYCNNLQTLQSFK